MSMRWFLLFRSEMHARSNGRRPRREPSLGQHLGHFCPNPATDRIRLAALPPALSSIYHGSLRTSMSEFVTVTKVGSIPEDRGGTYVVNGRLVAVFFTGGQYFAIDDLCPHMGASLGAGEV